MATHSTSGERHLGSSGVVASTAKPLAGRLARHSAKREGGSKLEKRLETFRGRGAARAQDVGFIRPMDESDEARPAELAGLQLCVACALSGATVASIIAILIFVFAR